MQQLAQRSLRSSISSSSLSSVSFLNRSRSLYTAPQRNSAATASSVTSSVASSPSSSSSSTAVRSLLPIATAFEFPQRLLRLADDLPRHSKPTFENSRWRKAKLSARDVARFRKSDLLTGGTFSEFETPRLRRIEPTVLKGHKREKIVADRKARIAEAMKTMESRIEEHHKNERARRVRPTFYQIITGKKPAGVIAAEEAALKERKEKNKERERARQAGLMK